MPSIGKGVWELKESDERAWYRVVYLTKIGSVIHVLHCFEKESRKTDKRDIATARIRLKRVLERILRGEKQVKSENGPSHITKGDVFDDLGLSRSEASALKVKATLLDAILREIERQGYTQNELVEVLDEYQPSVSNLTRGKIAKVSVEKLLTYSDRLKMKTTLTVHSSSEKHRTRGFGISRLQSLREKAGVAKG